ncbi:MAG: DUF4442 domain-containing protein [Myxococcota bacterium]
MYRQIATLLQKAVPPAPLFRHGFNLSPMYRSSGGRITYVSDDLHRVDVELPLTWRNRNYVGTMFGGSMLSATDPIYMVQLLNILGDGFVVWDKSVSLAFRRPAKSTLHARFEYLPDEVEHLRRMAHAQGSLDWEKPVELRDADETVIASGTKTIYVATKEHHRRRAARSRASG